MARGPAGPSGGATGGQRGCAPISIATVSVFYNRVPHMAGPSGYDQIVRYLDCHASVTTVPGMGYEVLPGAWDWLAERSYRWMPALTGLQWYDPWAAGLEVAAAARLLRHRGEILHFLHGEESYRFVSVLAGVARRRGHVLMATYHQPPAVFQRVVRVPHVLESLDAVVALCHDQASHLASLVGGDRVFTVPHGIDTHAFQPPEHDAMDRKLCLCVGSWLRDFGMLEAVVKAVAQIDPGIRFLVIGPEERVAPLSALPTVTARYEISDEQLLDAYRSAGLLVLPLTGSAANNALLEGMASGLPVIATSVGGVPEYVDEGAGVLVAPGDVGAMSRAIAAVTADETTWAEMGRRSRARALRFAWEKVAASTADVYAEVAARSRSRGWRRR